MVRLQQVGFEEKEIDLIKFQYHNGSIATRL